MALHSGVSPIFFNNPCVEEYVPYPMLKPYVSPEFRFGGEQLIDSQFLGICDTELGKTWDTMQAFCSAVNYAAGSDRKITDETFVDTMASVLYRLIGMKFPIASLDEAVRLGLSAFCSHVFLQWSSFRLPHHHLPTMYRECLSEHLCSDMASSELMPWLLMVGAMAVFPKGDTWLRPWLRWATGMPDSGASGSWAEVRASMKRLLWIDFVHDRCGEIAYNSVRRPSPLEAEENYTAQAYLQIGPSFS